RLDLGAGLVVADRGEEVELGGRAGELEEGDAATAAGQPAGRLEVGDVAAPRQRRDAAGGDGLDVTDDGDGHQPEGTAASAPPRGARSPAASSGRSHSRSSSASTTASSTAGTGTPMRRRTARAAPRRKAAWAGSSSSTATRASASRTLARRQRSPRRRWS